MSYLSDSIVVRALPPPLRGGGLLALLLFSLVFGMAGIPKASAHAPAVDTASSNRPADGFTVHPPGSYKLYQIKQAPDGKVLDTDGKSRMLSEFFGHGRITLLSFIYSSCADPNGCPYAYLVFHNLKSLIERERPELADRIRLVSLSFDPKRDTPETLRLYAGENSKPGQGVQWNFLTTASFRDLIPILDGYGQDVYIDLDPKTQQSLNTMSHVLKVFLIDREGMIREIYTTSYLYPQVVYNDFLTLLIEDGVIQQ